MEDDGKLYEAVTSLLIKFTALEKTLIESKVISKEAYLDNLKEALIELQKHMGPSGAKGIITSKLLS